jgi:hypothetical protein
MDAIKQHQSCPLYRLATRSLLAPGLYPVADSMPSGQIVETAIVPRRESVLLN